MATGPRTRRTSTTKSDRAKRCLEEIYYFEVRGGAGRGEPGPGGYQRVYSSGPDRQIDVLAEVSTGDTILIPFGYHGPTMAAPGYDLYFLNVLAGPAPERTMAFCDDPTHDWVRGSWHDQAVDPRLPMTSSRECRMKLTVAQALVRFLSVQSVERDDEQHRFFAGCFGIFGHGNVAGLGQALLESGDDFPYYLARNEQAMVHTAVGYARMSNRLRAFACTSSVGPGATNMVTGAGRRDDQSDPRACCCPVTSSPRDAPIPCSKNSRTRRHSTSRSTTRCARCRSTSTGSGDRSNLPEAMLHAMRVLTDPAETGAVTLALPQDVQTEAWEYPESLFEPRVWRIRRSAAGDRSSSNDSRRNCRSAEATTDRRRRRRHLQRGDEGAD